MSCPKCYSANLELERDRRVAGIRGPHQVQLHCFTCGFVLYGEKSVQEECDKQYAEYLRNGNVDPDPPKPPVPAKTQTTPAAEAPRAAETPAAKAESSSAEGDAAMPASGVQMCMWAGCGKQARPRSKYCSRNCSNKNARARHAARKK
ncbi:MAG: hypothetical protein GY913_23040 [Proteobacteria bacterium]|nr:hypothetical protein [Pseudomonadota bacterium]MCP4919788.1 hypothetical protein [Pseudomonadota bacterium]